MKKKLFLRQTKICIIKEMIVYIRWNCYLDMFWTVLHVRLVQYQLTHSRTWYMYPLQAKVSFPLPVQTSVVISKSCEYIFIFFISNRLLHCYVSLARCCRVRERPRTSSAQNIEYNEFLSRIGTAHQR